MSMKNRISGVGDGDQSASSFTYASRLAFRITSSVSRLKSPWGVDLQPPATRQDGQKDYPARPQQTRNRGVRPLCTSRFREKRERCRESFSPSC